MHAAVYLRLSKEDKHESIENQRLLLEHYCQTHGFCIVKEYRDEAVSGLSDERPGFRQMLRDAAQGSFQVIVAKSQSRFSRNYLHVEQYMHQELNRLGIRFIGVTDGVDTSGIGNKKARQIYALMNEWYCQDLSDNVRFVLQEKVKKGQFIGSFAPYGYKKSQEDSHRLERKEPEATAVKALFEGYAEGKSVKMLVQECKEKGIPAPDPRGSGWTQGAVYRILGNEAYIGTLAQGKTINVSYKDKRRIRIKPEQWIRKENAHEALVNEELFNLVQKRKARKGRKKG